MLPEPFLIVYAALLGLIVGSFLNVVASRLPRGESLVGPRSHCPYCGGGIRAFDNIPILSYLLLRGRCRRCRAPISARYPALEGATAGLFALCAARFGWSAEAAAAALFCALLLALATIDLEHFLLPDHITLPGILAGLVLQPWLPRTTLLDAAIGALAGAGAVVLAMNFWFWWRGEEGMGMGDVNMLAMVGAFLGWQGVAVTLFTGALAGAVTGVALMAVGRVGLKSKLPFGVFLALGAALALFWGPAWMERYLALL